MSRNPESLKVHALADALALEIHRLTTALPELERLIFGAQLRGASLATLQHIRTGCGKSETEAFMMELEEAASAGSQCHYLLTLARRVGMLPEADCAASEERALHLVRSLLLLMKAERSRQRVRALNAGPAMVEV